MTLHFSKMLLEQIQTHGEEAYPEEGAGFMFGTDEEQRTVKAIFALTNAREGTARHNRYLIKPEDYLKAEVEADSLGLQVIGVFHSHPDHPNRPSEFDKEWAQPFFSYVITNVDSGKAIESKSWRLLEDRSKFEEEKIKLTV